MLLISCFLLISQIHCFSIFPSNVEKCFQCLEHSKILVRCLYPHSPKEYQCLNGTTDLLLGSIIIFRACAIKECLNINLPPQKVYDKNNLCKESFTPLFNEKNGSVTSGAHGLSYINLCSPTFLIIVTMEVILLGYLQYG